MNLKDLIIKTRCYRRFDEQHTISEADLLDLVELARLTSSAKNMQPVRYILSHKPESNSIIFDTLTWAGYLPDWPGPVSGERPAAYLIQLLDTDITTNNYGDHNLAAQSILLGATEKGLGGCIIAAVDTKKLRATLSIPSSMTILQVIVLGKPVETVVLETLKADESHKYWRDKDGTHYVPKRKLEDLIWSIL